MPRKADDELPMLSERDGKGEFHTFYMAFMAYLERDTSLHAFGVDEPDELFEEYPPAPPDAPGGGAPDPHVPARDAHARLLALDDMITDANKFNRASRKAWGFL